MSMFNRNSNTPADLATTVQQGVLALTVKQEALTARKDKALSAFRSTANELAVVNTGLQETANIACEMAEFFSDERAKAELAISDNEAVRKRILEIIGE